MTNHRCLSCVWQYASRRMWCDTSSRRFHSSWVSRSSSAVRATCGSGMKRSISFWMRSAASAGFNPRDRTVSMPLRTAAANATRATTPCVREAATRGPHRAPRKRHNHALQSATHLATGSKPTPRSRRWSPRTAQRPCTSTAACASLRPAVHAAAARECRRTAS